MWFILRAALEAATQRVRQLGSKVVSSTILDAPDPELATATDTPNSVNPLYGGREYLLPADHPGKLAQ